jgi:hypothetical protein
VSYYAAKQAFQENQSLLGTPQRDPLAWNLSVGLIRLADALERDHQETLGLLQAIAQDLQRRK